MGVVSLHNPIDKPDFASEVVEVGVEDKHAKHGGLGGREGVGEAER